MNNHGGIYLSPKFLPIKVNVVTSHINISKFREIDSTKLSNVIVELEHKTSQKLFSDNSEYECNSKIKISHDGLLGMAIPSNLAKDEDVLNVMSNHINSFLANLSIGGIHFAPIQYNQIVKLKYEEKSLTLRNELQKQNFDEIIRNHSEIINFVYESDYIKNIILFNENYFVKYLNEAYNNGLEVTKTVFSMSDPLFLETFENYRQSKYGIALLLGWALIEIIITKYWMKNIIGKTLKEEKSRKDRLKDFRNYSSAIIIEFLY